jgi:hypothetical protein
MGVTPFHSRVDGGPTQDVGPGSAPGAPLSSEDGTRAGRPGATLFPMYGRGTSDAAGVEGETGAGRLFAMYQPSPASAPGVRGPFASRQAPHCRLRFLVGGRL